MRRVHREVANREPILTVLMDGDRSRRRRERCDGRRRGDGGGDPEAGGRAGAGAPAGGPVLVEVQPCSTGSDAEVVGWYRICGQGVTSGGWIEGFTRILAKPLA